VARYRQPVNAVSIHVGWRAQGAESAELEDLMGEKSEDLFVQDTYILK
jgi:hypothetical protein